MSGEIRIREDGEWRMARPLQKRSVDYPGVGSVATYTLGHPEPMTFPRYFPEIRDSSNVRDLPNGVIVLRTIARRVDRAELSGAEGARYMERAEAGQLTPGELFREGARQLASGLAERVTRKKYLPGLFAHASGKRAGDRSAVAASLDGEIPGGMGPMTCVPTAIALDMLGRGEIERKGVLAPEACIDPATFFSRLEPFVKRELGHGPLVRVVESWPATPAVA